MGVGREEKGAGETWRRRRRRGGGARPGGSRRARARPPASLATQATPWEEEEAFVSFFFLFFFYFFFLFARADRDDWFVYSTMRRGRRRIYLLYANEEGKWIFYRGVFSSNRVHVMLPNCKLVG